MEDGWISWIGGDCPVPPETNIQVRLRPFTDGRPQDWDVKSGKASDISRNGRDGWKHRGSSVDILAYKIINTKD